MKLITNNVTVAKREEKNPKKINLRAVEEKLKRDSSRTRISAIPIKIKSEIKIFFRKWERKSLRAAEDILFIKLLYVISRLLKGLYIFLK